ncbi:hypothetical protein Tco_0060655 [Tanacetum coccineum]
MIQNIQEECRLESVKGNSTILYEDNGACIAQIKEEAEKGDGLNKCAPSVRYAVRRLIRGVSSSREANKPQRVRLLLQQMLHLETSNKDGKYLDSPDQAQDVIETFKFRNWAKCLVNEAIGFKWWDEWCMEWFNMIKYLDVLSCCLILRILVLKLQLQTIKKKQKVIDSTLNEDRDDTNNNKGGIALTASSTSCDSEVDLVGGTGTSLWKTRTCGSTDQQSLYARDFHWVVVNSKDGGSTHRVKPKLALIQVERPPWPSLLVGCPPILLTWFQSKYMIIRMSMEGCSLKLVEGSSKASTMKLKYNHG